MLICWAVGTGRSGTHEEFNFNWVVSTRDLVYAWKVRTQLGPTGLVVAVVNRGVKHEQS